ncbi:MAG: general stress protein CsbD [Dissulfurispiraceae bacterium]
MKAYLRKKEQAMSCHLLIGNRKQFKEEATSRLGKTTDDHVVVIAGKRDMLPGKIQKKHSIACEQPEKDLGDCEASLQ